MAGIERPRRRGLVAAALAILLLVAGGLAFYRYSASEPSVSFRLTDGNGGEVSEKDFHGRYLLVLFGYTSCPDYCPGTLMVVAGVLERLPPDLAAKITPVFVTLDPDRDSPARAAEYARNFGPGFVGLGGSPAQVDKAKAAFNVYAKKIPGAEPGSYTIDHALILSLVGPDGRILARIPETLSARKLTETLNGFLAGPAASPG